MRLASPGSLPTALLVATIVFLSPGAAAADDAREAFFGRVAALCGSVFQGYSSFPPDPDHSFAGKLLEATVESCDETEIRVPFVVGGDRSRTWILSLSERGLLLKHDHRHADGTPDEITMYGGWATADGDALEQSFPADEHTRELLPEAATNVWTLSLAPDGSSLTYYLERHSEPRFKATLTRVEDQAP